MVLKILHEDENFIIVDKEYDIVINSNDPQRHSLHQQLVEKFPEKVNANLKFGFYFPHRLDYSTSGLMCIALSKASCAAAGSAFQNSLVEKYYLAILRGHVSKKTVTINMAIGEGSLENEKKMSTDGNCLRTAETQLLVLERGIYSTYPATKVLLRPITGRRHQLRVHCHLIGHTIVGDFTYSNKKDVTPPRMYLHAYRLHLPNKLNTIDITTTDPFIPAEVNDWHPVESWNELGPETMDNMCSTQKYITKGVH